VNVLWEGQGDRPGRGRHTYLIGGAGECCHPCVVDGNLTSCKVQPNTCAVCNGLVLESRAKSVHAQHLIRGADSCTPSATELSAYGCTLPGTSRNQSEGRDAGLTLVCRGDVDCRAA
jgi:hypothetical protein